MQLEGEYTFHAPVEAVWQALMDPEVLRTALPGGESLVQVGDNQYEAALNVRVGPVQGRFEGRIELADVEPLQGYRMKVSGQGAPGFVNGEGTLRLEPAAANSALLRYAGDVQIGGRIAGVSQRLVESSAKSITRQGLEQLERQVQARLVGAGVPAVGEAAQAVPQGAEPPPAPGVPEWQPVRAASRAAPEPIAPGDERRGLPPAAAPQPRLTPTSVMTTTLRDVARDLASDYIPPAQQEKLFWATVGALGMLLFVVLVRLVQKR